MPEALFQPPKTMPLPAALRYAREGYAIRRVPWDGISGGHALAWIIYRGGLYFYLDGEGRWVAQNDEVVREDFLARDWTLLPPGCVVWGGLPRWLAFHPNPVGYRLSQGYLLHRGRLTLIRNRFCKLCGTSTVWNAKFLRRFIPRTKSWEAAAKRSPGWLLSGLARHGSPGPELKQQTGHHFGVIHEPVAIYRYGTGFNVSSDPDQRDQGRRFAGKVAKLAKNSPAVDSKIAEEFGIPEELMRG